MTPLVVTGQATRFTAWCPSCRTDHEWTQRHTHPAEQARPVCGEEEEG